MISRGNEQHGNGHTPMPALTGHVDDWAELAVDYLDGRVTPEAKAAIQSHLQGCPACAARLSIQQGVVTYLQETYLDDPPSDLEDRVLGEVLFPSQPVTQPRKEEPQGWSVTWNKRIRPWIPATVAVVALLGAVMGYGLARSGSDPSVESVDITQPAATLEASSGTTVSASRDTTLGVSTTAAPTSTTTAVASAGPSETTVPMTAAEQPTEVVTDHDEMVDRLSETAPREPAYLAFMTAASEQSGESGPGEVTTTVVTTAGDVAGGTEKGQTSGDKAEEVADQITALTELTPLPDRSLWLGGPTFAAYLPRDDAEQLINLLSSIGASVQLLVGLITTPSAATYDLTTSLREHKNELCELVAVRTGKPSVANWSFTTSTLPTTQGQQDDWQPPDEAGTHVLIVIYVQNP